MDLRRLTRIIAARWGIVLIGALVGLAAAAVFLWLNDDEASAVFEATATVRFEPEEGETFADIADDVQDAQSFALLAADELLAEDPTSQITADLAEGRILFTTLAGTREDAATKAQALLQSYLEVDPNIGQSVDAELERLTEEAVNLQEQIDALQPALTPEEEALIADIDLLEQQITNINGRLAQIPLDLAAAATAEDRSLLNSERQTLELARTELIVEREALGTRPEPSLTPQEQLQLSTLMARMELLNQDYQRLGLRQLGVLAGLGSAEGISVVEIASEPVDPLLVLAAGLVGGLLISVVGLVMVSRTRRIVWLPEDVDVPILGQIPSRPVSSNAAEPWYDSAEAGTRKTAVQALRSSVQAHAISEGSTIAMVGHSVAPQDVQALAADLAGSMASAGESVLLIDANFETRSALGEYKVAGRSLADILRLDPDAPGFNAAVEIAVEEASVIRPGLSVIPAGPPPASPADALAGRQYRSFIAAAERQYDTTILVVEDLGSPSSQAAMQRARHSIVVTTPGTTTQSELSELLAGAQRLRIDIVGAVFLRRRRSLSPFFLSSSSSEPSRSSTPKREPKQQPEQTPSEAVHSPMTRLHNYSIPDERRSAAIQQSPLGDLAHSFGVEGDHPEEGLGRDLLSALEETEPKKAYAAVAEYLVSRAEDMVTARYGYGNLLDAVIDEVSEFFFLPLKPVRGHRTVGSWVSEEIEAEVGQSAGASLLSQLEELLGGDGDPVMIDEWLDREFFRRHLVRTEGEPEVWHLVSGDHTVSILVPARRLSAERLDAIASDVVSRTIDDLERNRKAAVNRADLEEAAECERQIWDAREFERGVNHIIAGGDDGKHSDKAGWAPNWLLSLRANLAPFQNQGLLPMNVLTEDEVATEPISA